MIMLRMTLVLLLLIAMPSITTAQTKAFRVLDATQFLDKPDLSKLGVEPLTVIYAHFLWPDEKVTANVPDLNFVEKQFKKYGSFNGAPWCIDIEHWPLNTSDDEAKKNSERFLQIISAARRANPKVMIGLYGELPLNSYYPAIADPDSDQNKKWVSDNIRSRHIAESVDYIFPAAYTYYNLPNEWALYATRQIQMARMYGKPVYVFIWPQYHDSNELHAFEFIDKKFWRIQLETAYKYADGVVIWGGWDFKRNRKSQWDENAAWWQETKDFITEIKAAPAAPANPSVNSN